MSSTTIPEIIEEIGFGPAQYVQLILMNGNAIFVLAVVILMGCVAKTIAAEFELAATNVAWLVAVLFIGQVAGNFAAGPLGDAFGRRLPILAMYAGALVFGGGSALSPNIYVLFAALITLAFAFGVGQPNKAVLGGEIVPAERRLHARATDNIFAALGGAYAVLLVWFQDPYMKQLSWRWLLGLAVLPSAIALVCAYLLMKESPRYLAIRMQYDDAEKVLDYMRKKNGKPDVDINFEPPLPIKSTKKMTTQTTTSELGANMKLVFGTHLMYTTLTLSVSEFTAWINWAGFNYCAQQVLPGMNLLGSPALNLLIGQFVEIPGILCSTILGLYISRKLLSIMQLMGCTCGILGFVGIVFLYGAPKGGPIAVALSTCFFVHKFFASPLIMTLTCFVTEVYPTKARSFGTSVCITCGRIGGILGPLSYGWAVKLTGSYAAFLLCLAALGLVSSALIFFIKNDPKGQHLPDHLEHENYQPNMDSEEKEAYELKLSAACRTSLTVVTAAAKFKRHAQHHYGATEP